MNGIQEDQRLESVQSVNQPIGTKKRNESIVGKTFGRLLVVKESKRGRFNEIRYDCSCECGNEKNVSRQHLIFGDVKSCGCYLREFKLIHGMSGTRTYHTWESMIDRCNNPNNDRFKDYGGRGIRICERWLMFENFLKDMGVRPIRKTLNRINNNGNYEPENCCWSTAKEQSRNSRLNKIIKFNNESKCVAEWAEILGINHSTLRKRLSRGWTVSRAFTTLV